MFYNIRYVDKTGRDTHPWSTRTVGIYQKYNFQTKSNTWTVIQPSIAIKRLIVSSTESHSLSPLSLHTTLLNSTLVQWPAYLKHLNCKIINMVGSCGRSLLLLLILYIGSKRPSIQNLLYPFQSSKFSSCIFRRPALAIHI